MTKPKFQIGDEVYVRDPGKYLKNARSIHGVIDKITSLGSSFKYEFMSERIAVSTGEGYFDFAWHKSRRVSIHEVDLSLRVGTPLSQLDGRNGGNAAWRRISESWGHI